MDAAGGPAIAPAGNGSWAVGWAEGGPPIGRHLFNVVDDLGDFEPNDQQVFQATTVTASSPGMAATGFGIAYAAPIEDADGYDLRLAIVDPTPPLSAPPWKPIRTGSVYPILVGGVAVAPDVSEDSVMIGVASRDSRAFFPPHVEFFDTAGNSLNDSVAAPMATASGIDIAWSEKAQRFGVAVIHDTMSAGSLIRYEPSSPFAASTPTEFTTDYGPSGALVAIAATEDDFVVVWNVNLADDELRLRLIDAESGLLRDRAQYVGYNEHAPQSVRLLYDGRSVVAAWSDGATEEVLFRRFNSTTLQPLGEVTRLTYPSGLKMYGIGFDLAHSGINSYALTFAAGPGSDLRAPTVLLVTCDGP